MRRFFALFVPLCLLFSLPASANGLDVKTVTCAELVQADQSTSTDDHFGAAVLLSWLAGYHATEEQGTVVDFEALKVDVQRTVAYCKNFPKVGVFTASRKFMGENATEASSEAVDLSAVKCQRVVETAGSDDEEGLAVIMMWLAGYYASDAEDTILDQTKLEKQGYEVGKACALNAESGLITVADEVMHDESE